MEGTITALARVFFKVEIRLELIKGRQDGSCDHEVYLLSFPRQELGGFAEARERLLLQSRHCLYAPTPDLFYQMFPFHFILDRECRLLQVSM